MINAGNDAGAFFGIEGGHMARVHDLSYTAITEFTAPPLWVPSKFALWKATMPTGSKSWPQNQSRARTLFKSGGETDCHSFRASLGSSAALAFDDATNHWLASVLRWI